jgi:prepilin-type N-terminal cleavage/methylation domain-containing protein
MRKWKAESERGKRKAESGKPEIECLGRFGSPSFVSRFRSSRFQLSPFGFSLLEVILALAILAGALVALGEIGRMGMQFASLAQNLSQAQLICESKMAEIISGETQAASDSGVPTPPDTSTGTSTGADSDSDTETDLSQWTYTVDVEPVENQSVQNLLAVTVTVAQNLPKESHPASCTLTRWITDPNATYSTSSSTSSLSGSGTTQ